MTNHWMKQTTLALGLVASLSQVAGAQEGGPSAERFFGFIDRNRDGVIDRKEAESAPGPMRDALLKMNLDKGLSQKDFEKAAQPIMDSFRQRRDEGGDRDREKERERDRDRDRDRGGESRSDNRSTESSQPPGPPPSGGPPQLSSPGMGPRPDSGSGSSKSSSGKKSSASKVRVTYDLPSNYRPLDLNHDGQIGLFEWDRTRYADFITLDRNGDGLLTAKEVLGTKIAPPKPRVTETAAASDPAAGATASTPASPSASSSGRGDSRFGRGPGGPPGSSAAPKSGSSKTVSAPEKVDADSQEGRMAKFNFGRLDLDKDGSLTAEEWSKSQSIRASFEKAGVKLTFPLDADQFAGWQIAVQKAERAK